MADGPERRCHVERIAREVPEPPARTAVLLLDVAGMGCVNCANRVYNALVRLPGVVKADVVLESRAAWVEYDPDDTEPEAVLRAVAGAGAATGHRYVAAPIHADGFTG